MSQVTLLTGGARSGKSALAEEIAKEAARDKVLYIATAAVCDEEMADRVKKHREARPKEWRTYEGFWNFEDLKEKAEFQQSRAVLIDCLGFMLNNIMYHLISDWDACTVEEMNGVEARMIQELECLIDLARTYEKDLIIVTNEVGMGLVPEDRSSRYYRDILGRANRTAASRADRVCFMVAGLPLYIKG